jgi:hypothetical protein
LLQDFSGRGILINLISRLYELMRGQYGKNYGTIANLKTSSGSFGLTNGGGPVVIENPDILKAKEEKKTNGHTPPDLACTSSKSRIDKVDNSLFTKMGCPVLGVWVAFLKQPALPGEAPQTKTNSKQIQNKFKQD